MCFAADKMKVQVDSAKVLESQALSESDCGVRSNPSLSSFFDVWQMHV